MAMLIGMSSISRGQLSFLQNFSVKNSLNVARSCNLRRFVHSGTDGKLTKWSPRKAESVWLFASAGMVSATIIIGGVTRLTESGLSMVDWRVFREMMPPITEEDWLAEFEKYKLYPDYKQFVQWEKYVFRKSSYSEMTLHEFKAIWVMEYAHRMLARSTGLVFAVPAVYFWLRGRLASHLKVPVLTAGTLFLSQVNIFSVQQALLGWYMVKSGLESGEQNSHARISQYRLTAHLSLAVGLYGLLFWYGLSSIFPPSANYSIAGMKRLKLLSILSVVSTSLTTISGGFVAGLNAGLVYNSWPKFADRWIPTDLLTMNPTWLNFFDNPTTVQFVHRNLRHHSFTQAYMTVALVTATWLVGCRLPLNKRCRRILHAVITIAYLQAAIGVGTLLHHVPVSMGALHQIDRLNIQKQYVELNAQQVGQRRSGSSPVAVNKFFDISSGFGLQSDQEACWTIGRYGSHPLDQTASP
ncbi:Cytochrome c oxidase assembly protein COX15 -like protein [Trichinella britovi]|uniref:Cytochrome c oxidase assembly protein COX15-like protein n=1 Tax=Trichinella britovi TaxID=45882 RepID=A0A0V1CW64_TRIBR|nr:Cytochrome c oxidase assembly protein COX15 -like protein [Trichinella britovi]